MKAQKIIKEWLGACIKNQKWDDHLHIDYIDKKYEKAPDTWIDGGLEMLSMASDLFNSEKYVVVLCIALYAEDKQTGIDFKNKLDLDKQLSNESPSLYVFERNSEQFDYVTTKPKIAVSGIVPVFSIYFQEFKREDGDYTKNVFVIRNNC